MKTKAFFLVICFFLLGLGSISAQKSSQNDEVKAKVSQAIEKLNDAFKLEKEKLSAVENILSDFYTAQQKLKNNIQRPATGLAQGLSSQDFQSIRKKNETLIADRDKRLKEQLSEDQFKKWKGSIEPSLHKRRK